MNITEEALIGLATTLVVSLMAGGWAIMRAMNAHIEQRQEDLASLIKERFAIAEQQRREASMSWQQLFQEMQRRNEQHSARLSNIEQRVYLFERLHRNRENQNP